MGTQKVLGFLPNIEKNRACSCANRIGNGPGEKEELMRSMDGIQSISKRLDMNRNKVGYGSRCKILCRNFDTLL